MADKKNNFISKFFLDIVMIIFSLFKFIPSIIFLIETETRTASKNIVSLLILYLVAGTLLLSTWLCLLTGCFLYLISLHLSSFLSLFIMIVINILLLIITALMILRAKNNLSFPKTRELLRNINIK